MWSEASFEELKTFNEIIEEQTQDVVFADTTLDEATQAALIKWFGYRRVCDNDKFVTFFNRLLLQRQDQYTNLLRIQTIKFDPLVTTYLERLIEKEGTQTVSGTTKTVGSGSATRTDNLEGTSTVTTKGTVTDSGNHSNTITDSGSNSSSATTTNNLSDSDNTTTSNRAMNAQLPQSSTSSSGFPSSLNWTYATAQTESAETRNDTQTHTGTVKNESSGTNGNTRTDSGTNGNTETIENTVTGKTTNTGTVSNSNESTSTDTSNVDTTNGGTTKERYTGRNGDAPELMQKAVNFIMTTNCFMWLVDALEPVFMSTYD